MKKITATLLLVILAVGNFSVAAQINREFVKNYKNGRVYRESKKLPSIKGFVFKHTTYYDNGDVMREEEWRNNKRNGWTKVYLKNNRLVKEIRFLDDYMMEYTAYKNGQVYTKINADRSLIINKGRTISARWDKYYETRGTNRLLQFSKKGLVDWMARWTIPEEVTQIFEDLANHFDSKPGAPNSDDMLTCGGSTDLFNDRNVDLRSLGSGKKSSIRDINTRPGQKASAQSVVTDVFNTCANKTRSSLGGGIGGFGRERAANIQKARNTISNMVAACDGPGSGSGLISVGPGGFISTGAILEEIIAMEAAAAAATAETTVVGATVVATEGAAIGSTAGAAVVDATVITGISGTTSSAGAFILADVAIAMGAVAIAAVAGVAIGTAINESVVGKALTEFIAKVQDSNDAELQKAIKEAADAQAKAEKDRLDKENAEKKKKEEEDNKAKPKDDKKVAMPVPDGVGEGSACQRMAAFGEYCDKNGWRDFRCENFIRTVRGCKGNVTEMYVTGDGNVMDVGCPSDGDRAAVQAAADCAKKGMIGMPGGAGGSMCRSGSVDRALPISRNDLVTDPPRSEFREIFGNTAIKTISANELNASLNSPRSTMVVFMSPDCPACQVFSQTLKSVGAANGFAAIDVQIIDVEQSPELMEQFGIRYFPSYFVAKSGKRTPMTVGAMSFNNLRQFLSDSGRDMK